VRCAQVALERHDSECENHATWEWSC
jgi:hypothetical protein